MVLSQLLRYPTAFIEENPMMTTLYGWTLWTILTQSTLISREISFNRLTVSRWTPIMGDDMRHHHCLGTFLGFLSAPQSVLIILPVEGLIHLVR